MERSNRVKWTFLFLLSLVPLFFPWMSSTSDIDTGRGFDVFAAVIGSWSAEVPWDLRVMTLLCTLSPLYALLCIWLPRKDSMAALLFRVSSEVLLIVCYVFYVLCFVAPELISGGRLDSVTASRQVTPFFWLSLATCVALAVYHIVSRKRRQE